MNKAVLLIFISFWTTTSSAQNRALNQSTPRNTVEEIFRCARTGDYSQIHLLCDPLGRGDGDTKELCSINLQSQAQKIEFRNFFKLAYTIDQKIIKERGAEVNFKFGPRAQKNETMRLIKRNGKWYLNSF